jgi:myo-inositol-1-phosphate synthase
MKKRIERAKGKLGILIAGLGTAATTFIAGVEAIKKGLAEPLGSLTQTGNIRLDRKTGSSYSKLKDYVSFANVKDIVFGGWDIYNDSLLAAITKAQTVQPALALLQQLKPELETIVPMKAVADESAISDLDIAHIKRAENKFELAKQVIYDIENFSVANNCTRLLIICFLPTEGNIEVSEVHNSIEAFEEGLCDNHPAISPSMIYAYASLSLGVPFVNGSGNLTCDIPALTELAKNTNTPVAGKEFKTLETYEKAVYSSNLSDKIRLRFGSVAGEFQKKVISLLPGDFISTVSVVLDAALFIDLAKRAAMRGIQEWLSFYFTAPQAYPRLAAEFNVSKQLINLQNALYYLKGRDLIAHLDLDYYE